MVVFRVGKTEYCNDLLGEGARLFGGRWNLVGVACLYTSSSRALSVLEYSVNLNAYEIPKLLSFTLIEIPDNEIYEVNIKDLPDGWNSFPVPTISRLFGSTLLTGSNKAIIKIPSTIITKEFNYLLNPYHKESYKFKIVEIEDFVYDDRIKAL
ncbi:RES family NAD+ phosphorylase [Flavobacterium sp.]|uniref:RES family NAD+ phosphorylase n=1 Tax=Flavobacterium sp. TaxID=239 RepID=UPI0037500E4E